ncbi:hypothetical protein [Kallotenue papyrolyticum]|uniref:hypothetical protein n=1 Tax=Kallotenue papyrolyticum TaxID=1325125 RepID=UPI00049298E7|nr:hypothetical protein [Kallotenue papyrolyticum]
METKIIAAAIAFVQQLYGVESSSLAAQMSALAADAWQVTVWIGPSLFQRLVVTADGVVSQLG